MRINIEKDYYKSIGIILTGTVISQVIVLLLTPIFSRLYSPEQTADFSIFFRITLLISTLITARYELAMTLPKHENHAFILFKLLIKMMKIGFIVLIPLLLIFFILSHHLEVDFYLYILLPFSILPLCLINVGNSWLTRIGDFQLISKLKITTSLTTNIFNVVMGIIGFNSLGLIISYILGLIIPSIIYLQKYFNLKNKYHFYKNPKRIINISREFIDFPKVNLPHAIMDMAKEVFIVIFILMYFQKSNLGSYDFSFKILKLPLTIIGYSIGQVYFSKISQLNNDGESVYVLTKNTCLKLIFISILPFLSLYLWGEELFVFFFGENWEEAGKYSEILAPWLFLNFVTSPISQLPIVKGKLKSFFYISLISTIMMLICLNLPIINLKYFNFDRILFYMNLTQTVFFIYLLFWLLKISKLSK